VICVKPAAGPAGLGGDPAAGTVILCAHFDSRSERGEDPRAPAPGADDNASGVAVLLETARLLAVRRSGIPVRFAAFSGEEQGLWGAESVRGADTPRPAPGPVRAQPRPGRPSARSGTLTIERDAGNRVAANDAASHALADRMRRLARRYTGLPTRFGPIYGSDYLPFEARGFTVAGLYEGEGYPAYHTTRDTAEKVNFAYLRDVARLTLATVLNEEQGRRRCPVTVAALTSRPPLGTLGLSL
jgi:Zn-dependent M28 family amino/carboxypeptidase